ncbi:MAG: aminotransferase class IV [Candidatus Moraniibacteriota bacterium]|nr:MAG: aminotransferase class IV [Candidatus Moranbacteria bacterium]
MKKNVAYLNGEYVSLDVPALHLRDLGFLRGYGVFDVSRVFEGKIFRHKEHWHRLKKSAQILGLSLPITQQEHGIIIQKLLSLNEKNNKDALAIRTVLTGGVSEGGFLPEGKETFSILIEDVHVLPITNYTYGVSLETLEHKRYFPEAKTIDYITPIAFRKKYPEKKDIFEILYVWEGRILEASTSNISIVKNGSIFSPKEDVLGGITRLVALQIAQAGNISVYEENVSLEQFFDADEVFITASNKKIVPVISVDGKKIGEGVPGKITKFLLKEYDKIIERKET